ncbi:MAG: FHA domain-containing protein [Thermodesulfobacteriota bacterium]
MSDSDQYTIGRSRQCHLILSEPSVSAIHAKLSFTKDGRIRLTDLGSTNGTYRLDGGRFVGLTNSYVSPTDMVRFGAVEIQVKTMLEALHLLTPPGKSPAGAGQDQGPVRKIVKGKKLVRCQCGNVKAPGRPCSVCGSVTTGVYK